MRNALLQALWKENLDPDQCGAPGDQQRGANQESAQERGHVIPFGNPLCFVDETSLFTARLIE